MGENLCRDEFAGPPARVYAIATPSRVYVRYSREDPRLGSASCDEKQIGGFRFHLTVSVPVIWKCDDRSRPDVGGLR
jgi:hypothetical protein